MTMFKSSALVLVVALCAGLALTQVHSQGVNARAASPDQPRLQSDTGGPGSASRNVYAQRQLSPHRMMHFGKRPFQAGAPSVMALDPNQVAKYLMLSPLNDQELRQEVEIARQEQERELDSASKFPYSLYFDLTRNRVLEPVFEDPRLQILTMANFLRQTEAERRQKLQQQKQKRKMMHVQSRALADERNGGGNRLDEAVAQVVPLTEEEGIMKQSQQRFAELNQLEGDEQQQQQQQQTSTTKPPPTTPMTTTTSEERAPNQENNADSINLVNRSPTMPFSEPGDPYTKAQIFNYLYGRQGPMVNPTVTYKRKSEPGRMTFMHFG